MDSLMIPTPHSHTTISSSPSSSSSTPLTLFHLTCFSSFSPSIKHPLKLDRKFSIKTVSAVNGGALMSNSTPPKSGMYTVGDFMTKKELLHAVKPTTTIDEALELLVENRITGFPVIDDDWKLVGLVSDYDLLALDSVSDEKNKTKEK